MSDRPPEQPVHHTSPRRQFDFAKFPGSYGLIALTVAVYLAQAISDFMIRPNFLLELGMKSGPAIVSGEYWRFLTPIFLHIGILHLFVNMYSLYAIGPAVERFFGTPRFIAQYLLAGFAGVIFSLAFSPSPSAGASGAIFGLLGSLGAFLYIHRELFGQFGRVQLRQIALVALLNLGLGLMPGIDNWGHLGGLLAGTFLTLLIGPRFEIVWVSVDERQVRDQRPWQTSRLYYLLAAIILIAIAAVAALLPQAP
jgi:rhomboid protease GluP